MSIFSGLVFSGVVAFLMKDTLFGGGDEGDDGDEDDNHTEAGTGWEEDSSLRENGEPGWEGTEPVAEGTGEYDVLPITSAEETRVVETSAPDGIGGREKGLVGGPVAGGSHRPGAPTRRPDFHCPDCRERVNLVQEYGKYYCDSCGEYVSPIAMGRRI